MMSMSLQLLFVIFYFVTGGLLVVVQPLIVIPAQRAVTIDSGSRQVCTDVSATTLKRQNLVSLRQNQQRPNVSLLRMSLTFHSQDEISMPSKTTATFTRRKWIDTIKTGVVLISSQQLLLHPKVVSAKPDCYTDCYKNCIALAPKDNAYCSESCTDYCSQDDRQDGLSGSVSSEKGEVGILGGSFGTGTVVKGQDKPPVLGKIPGLDFTSESGKKMIGY